ncbi:hypothetical protein ACF0H5_014656 [Mactra antiquata]
MELISRTIFTVSFLLLGLANVNGINFEVDIDIVNNLNNLTEIRISDRLEFEFGITVPIGSFSLTSLIYGNNDIFSLCDVHVVSIGSNFVGIQPADFTPNITSAEEVNGVALPYPYSITPPITNISGPGPVLIGDMANWTITLDLQDGVNKIQVDAWINGTYEYPVCDLVVVETGPAFGCFNKATTNVSYHSNITSIVIPEIINTEFNKNLTVSNGTDIYIVAMGRVPFYATVNDVLYANVDVYIDDKLMFSLSEQIQLDDSSSLSSPAGTPTITVNSLGAAGTIAAGSGLVFSVDIGTPPGEMMVYYDVIISADADVVKVCDVQLMEIGSNLCMDHNISTVYTSSSSNQFFDGATVNVGSVVNLRYLADPANTNNSFRLEVAVCLPDDTTAQNGDTLTLGVDAYYDVNSANKKVSGSKTYSVSADPDLSLATDGFYFVNTTTVLGYISDVVTVDFTVAFNETTDKFNLSVSVPVVGGNALGLRERSSFVDPASIQTSSQVTFVVSLVVADHVLNTAGSLIPITAVLEGATGFSANGTSNINVQISGTETPMLIFDFWMENFLNTDKVSGDNVTCHAQLSLNESSTAHAQDVVIHVMTPHYIGFDQVYDIAGSNVTVNSNGTDAGFDITIGEVDFKDNITFWFTFILDPTLVMPPGTVNLRTVVPVDMTYRGEIRGDRVDLGVLYSGYIVHEFGFNSPSTSPVGVEDGTILDCQMQASSNLTGYQSYEARLNVGNGWKPLYRGKPFCGHEYIQINMGTPAYITSLLVQSTTDNSQDIITSFYLQYSDDTMVWYDVLDNDNINTKEFTITVPGGSNINDVYEIQLNQSQRFTAQHIKLVSGVCISGIRIEFKGMKQSGPPVDCTQITTQTSTIPDQSYVINDINGTMFVCGLSQVGGDVICSRSEDGLSWQGIEDSISHVVGVVSNTTLVIAKTDDDSSYLLSEDDGYSWNAINDNTVTEIRSLPGYTPSVALPYDDYSSISNNNMFNAHGMLGPDGFKLTGVMEGIAVSSGFWDVTAWWGTEDWSTL